MDEVGYWQRQARRRITRRRALSVGAMGAGGAALAAVGCGDDDDDDDGGDSTAAAGGAQRDASQLPSELANARYGGTFILVINDPPIGFDFHATEQPGSQIGAFGVYNGLFRRPEDPPGNFLGLQPELVEDYEQPDETTLVMKFHEGVKWQDVAPVSGRPFTSEDVKYNLERMRGEHPAANQVAGEFRMRDLFQPVESMEASDDRTLTLKTAFPFAPLLDHLSFSWVQMMPHELVDGNHEYTVFNRAIGTGPFIMESYDTLGDGGRIKYVRNPDYFKKGQPFFDAMELPIVTSSETIQAMFLQGDTDTSGTGLDATLTAALKEARPDMKTFEASGFFLFKVYWDMANQDSPWARDVRMRQAMWYFMPYDALLNQLGVTCCRTGPMPPGQKPWALPNEDLPGSGLDLQSSIQEGLKLLDAAGYPAGTEIPLELSISNFYGGDLLGEVLTAIFGGLKQASGGALNINVRLNVMELGSWLKDVYRGGGTFEATSHADAVFHDPDNGFYRYYHSTGVANNTHLNDPKVDDFLERQRREFDHEKRVEVVHEFQRYLLDISPTVYIVAPNSFSGAQPWVENYKTHTIGYLETLRHWDELWFNETAPQR